MATVDISEHRIERLHCVDLDVVLKDHETAAEAAIELGKGLAVEGSILQYHGPGGGHPIIRFTGPRQELVELLKRYDPSMIVHKDDVLNAPPIDN